MSIDVESNGNGGAPAAGETDQGQELLGKSLYAANRLAEKAAGADSGAEAKDFTAGILNLAQVIALLDPTRDEKGVPLDHEKEMQKLQGQQELERVREQAKSQAPAPKKALGQK